MSSLGPKIDVSASSETLIWPNEIPEVLKGFESDAGGVWCAGAASTLQFDAEARGWTAVKLQYGFQEALTHAVTLVLTTEGWVIADAYLGNTWDKPLAEALGDLQSGFPVAFSGEGVVRDVHFTTMPVPGNPSWLIGRRNSWPLPCRQSGDRTICRIHHDGQDFADRYDTRSTMNLLLSNGHPADLSFLLLYPYGLVTEAGYVDVSSIDEMLDVLGTVE